MNYGRRPRYLLCSMFFISFRNSIYVELFVLMNASMPSIAKVSFYLGSLVRHWGHSGVQCVYEWHNIYKLRKVGVRTSMEEMYHLSSRYRKCYTHVKKNCVSAVVQSPIYGTKM